MSKVKVMDEILANKIAAGEVVERCVSVVKELVENAIDAESTNIKIELIDAGIKEIKVTDNGIGMEKEDAVLAFQRHATSKIYDEDDLFRIDTLGFRGEALPSIASVSKVELITSTGEVGTSIHIEGGHLLDVKPAEARRGTSITVKELFYNVPARLKHMKSLYAELANVTDYINKIALSYPNIRFTLYNNGNVLLNTDGSGSLLKTIRFVYGIALAKKMIEVKAENDDYMISGYISLPEIHRSSKNSMVILVNNRVVRNTIINRIINDAYHSYKPDNRYPVVVLNISVDTSLVDVNIHPTKMDVKFSKMEELTSLIQTMIQNKLKEINLIPHIDSNVIFKEEEKKDFIKPRYEEVTLQLEREESTTKIDHTIDEEETPYILNDKLLPKEESIDEEIKNQVEENENEERLPEIYPIGSVHGTYLICQNELGMYMIDQHAAKERVNYEICLEHLTHPKHLQTDLLFPIIIELSNSEFVIMKQNMEILRNMDFDVEEFGINSIIIKAHPVWIPKGNEEAAIRKVVELVILEEKNFDLAKFYDHIAATMACKMSIKANDLITMKEMENLIKDLRNCKNPFHCPHGRPTIIFYSKAELEKLFKRSGF